jgi:hypothetical protein
MQVAGDRNFTPTARYAPVGMTHRLRVKCQKTARGMVLNCPTDLSSRPKRTRISCLAALDTTTCAAFIKESRMRFADATELYRKSGVAKWRELLFLFRFSYTL